MKTSTTGGLLALSPALLFPGLYLGVSLYLGDFYAMPVTIALLVSSIWSIVVLRGRTLSDRINTFSGAAASDNILYMVWIFILAGAFAALARGMGAIDATVRLTLTCFPPDYVLPGMFLAACVISMSIGTSVGTVVALTPLVVELSTAAEAPAALYVAAVLSGAFFGDNLSFISDTTVAATRSQGCTMDGKFKANLRIVLPAALVTLCIYAWIGFSYTAHTADAATLQWSDAVTVLPYAAVIVLAVAGINVLTVLTSGIVLALIIASCNGVSLLQSVSYMGEGIGSMGELIVITLLAAGMLGVVKAAGGIDLLLDTITRLRPGYRGAQATVSLLTGAVNLCTANNTVAIITTGSITADISRRYNIAPRRAASLLDTSSCIVQCLIPYGAQTLLATGLAGITPGAPWPYLYYPWLLAASLTTAIVTSRRR